MKKLAEGQALAFSAFFIFWKNIKFDFVFISFFFF